MAEALVADPRGRTYPAVAAALGVHVGTVHRHLARIRAHRPAAYRALMAARASYPHRTFRNKGRLCALLSARTWRRC